jgi:hypothetical protein
MSHSLIMRLIVQQVQRGGIAGVPSLLRTGARLLLLLVLLVVTATVALLLPLAVLQHLLIHPPELDMLS